MTRGEHIKWAKARALALCDAGDPDQAVASIVSDLIKHDETMMHPCITLGMHLVMARQFENADHIRKWIEGIG